MRQTGKGTFVEWHGVVLEAGEVVLAQVERRGPQLAVYSFSSSFIILNNLRRLSL